MLKWIGLAALALWAAAAADRPDLNGAWQLDPAHCQPAPAKLKSEMLTIRQTEDAVEIADDSTASNGKENKIEIQCNTMGQECKLKSSSVSLWYNGPMLVLIEKRHGNDIVVRKRLKPSEDGKTMTMEVSYLTSPGHQTENYIFTKQ